MRVSYSNSCHQDQAFRLLQRSLELSESWELCVWLDHNLMSRSFWIRWWISSHKSLTSLLSCSFCFLSMQLLESTCSVVFIFRIILRRRTISGKSVLLSSSYSDPQLVKTGTKLCMSYLWVMMMTLMLAFRSKITDSEWRITELQELAATS